MSSGSEGEVTSWLRRQADLEEALADLVRIESHPATLAQNDVIDVIEQVVGTSERVDHDRWIPDWDEVERFPAPDDSQLLWSPLRFRDDRYDEILPELEVSVHSAGEGGRTIMLNGHSDVVPVDGQLWTSAPFGARIVDGRMVGRGVMDMKAGLLASAYAFRYLAEHHEGPGRVLLATVPEEETGGNGTLAALHRGWVPDAAVFAEPTDLRLVHRHVGIQGFDVALSGREGGMLRRSWADGVAPSLARAGVALAELQEVRTLRARQAGGYDDDDLPGFVNYTIHSGEWPATRSGSGALRGLMGLLPGETQADAVAELDDAVRTSIDADGIRVSVDAWSGGHRGSELPESHDLVRAFAGEAGEPGAPSRAGTMVCDAKIVQGGGWAPSIALGPVGGGLHAADEWVDLESVGTLVQLLVRGVERYLNHDQSSSYRERERHQ